MKKKKAKPDNLLVCDDCGSSDVHVKAWVDANTNEFKGYTDETDRWCDQCECFVEITSLKRYNEREKI